MNSSQKKGAVGIIIALFIVVVVGFAFSIWMIISSYLQVTNAVNVQFSIDDRGSSITSLLKTKSNGNTYMEILGMTGIDSSRIDDISNTVTSMKLPYSLYLGDKPLSSYSMQTGSLWESMSNEVNKLTQASSQTQTAAPQTTPTRTSKPAATQTSSYPSGVCAIDPTSLGITLSESLRWPFDNKKGTITSGIVYRNLKGEGCKCHTGIDIAGGGLVKGQDQIKAIMDGIVDSISSVSGYGNSVVTRKDISGRTYYTLYGHMDSVSSSVSLGKEIKAGDVLGTIGTTGKSTGVHLHLEMTYRVGTTRIPVDICRLMGSNLADSISKCYTTASICDGKSYTAPTWSTVSSTSTSSYLTDIPLPGARPNSFKTQLRMVYT